jgi:heme exporter protein A
LSSARFEGSSATGAPALELDGIVRRFGRRWVLRGVSLRVEPGQVVALTGRNGSGKTTLLRVLTTGLRPTRGSGRVFGHELVADAAAVRERVGILAHSAGLYEDLTAGENLEFAQRMGGEKADAARIGAALEQVGLGGERRERVRGFSAGMRRRLALARLLLRPPSLLLLDEPYASFDADGLRLVNGFAAEVAAAGGAVVIATHELARGRGLVDRTVRITDGVLSERDTDADIAADAEPGAWAPLQVEGAGG